MPVVDLILRPSKAFYLFQVMALCLTFAVLMILDISLIVKLFLAGCSGLYVFFICYQQGRFRRLVTDGRVWQLDTAQTSLRGTLAGDSTVNAWVMVLRLSVPQKNIKVSYVLFAEGVPKDTWRRLRVLARYGR